MYRPQQRILADVIVSRLHCPVLKVVAEIPAEGGYDRLLVEPSAMQSKMQKPGCDNTGAIDDHADDFTSCLPQASVDRGRRGHGRRFNPEQPKIAIETFDDLRVKGRARSVVYDNYLVVLGIDMALVAGR
jgi:hypothetical protein